MTPYVFFILWVGVGVALLGVGLWAQGHVNKLLRKRYNPAEFYIPPPAPPKIPGHQRRMRS